MRRKQPVFFGITLNPGLAKDVDSATNNTAARVPAMAPLTGGELFDIAAFALNPQPFFENFVQAITGVLAATGTTGIVVENNASPNLIEQHRRFVRDRESASRFVRLDGVGGTVYRATALIRRGSSRRTSRSRGRWGPAVPQSVLRQFLSSRGFPDHRQLGRCPGGPAGDGKSRRALGIAASPIQTPKYDAFGQ